MMRARSRLAVQWLGIGLLLAASLATGCGVLSTARDSGAVSGGSVAPMPPQDSVTADGAATEGYAAAGASVDSAQTPERVSTNTLIISTAGMSLEVKDLDAGVAAIRALAAKYGASIANLSTNAGSEPVPVPEPLDSSSEQYMAPTPGGATITLRIPSQKLEAAERDIAALGRVVSQTSSQDDVTQQHVDMKARLKNLQAEEMRLRTFFQKAKRVSEMLAIEQELSRVRGEIESMQAQITYLESQAALATLTVALTQPGALVSPSAGGWGFSEAIRDGVRAAAAVVRGLITTLLAFSPLILLGVLLFIAIRALVRRHKRRAGAAPAAHGTQGADASDMPAETSEQ